MSADNGIYIAEFSDGFRVIHAQAIDNLTYFPLGSPEEKKEWKSYFDRAKVFKTREEAILYAHKRAETYPVLEYGVCDLGRGVDFEEEETFEQREKRMKRNKDKSARREAKKRAIQSRVEKEKLKPSPPVFQIGEQIAWKGVWFRVVKVFGENEIVLKANGFTANYLMRGGDKEIYVKASEQNDKGSTGTNSKELVGDSGGEGVKETSGSVEGIPRENSETGRDPKVV